MRALVLLVALQLSVGVAHAAPSKKKPAKKTPPAPARVEEPPAPLPAALYLVPVVRGEGVAEPLGKAVEQAFEESLRKLRSDVVTAGSVAAELTLARQRQLAGTGDAAAAAVREVDELVGLRMEKSGTGYDVTATKQRGTAPPTSAKERAASDSLTELHAVAEKLVAALFEGAKVVAQPAKASNSDELRVAVLEPRITGEVPQDARRAFSDSLAPEVRKLKMASAISSTEIRDLLSLERQRQLLGCGEASTECMVEVANALDAHEVLTVDVVLVGNSYSVSARRLDVRAGRVLTTYLKTLERGTGEELPLIVGPMIEQLYPERPLMPGMVRGVSPEVISRLIPPPLPRWLFFTTMSLAVVAGGAGGTFGYFAREKEREHAGLVANSLSEPQSAAALAEIRRDGYANARMANIFYAGAGVLAAACVVEYFLTDWRPAQGAPSLGVALSSERADMAVTLAF